MGDSPLIGRKCSDFPWENFNCPLFCRDSVARFICLLNNPKVAHLPSTWAFNSGGLTDGLFLSIWADICFI